MTGGLFILFSFCICSALHCFKPDLSEVLTLLGVCALFIVFGAVNYAYYGAKTQSVITLNLPHQSQVSHFLPLAFALASLFNVPLFLLPAALQLEASCAFVSQCWLLCELLRFGEYMRPCWRHEIPNPWLKTLLCESIGGALQRIRRYLEDQCPKGNLDMWLCDHISHWKGQHRCVYRLDTGSCKYELLVFFFCTIPLFWEFESSFVPFFVALIFLLPWKSSRPLKYINIIVPWNCWWK